MFMQDNYMVGTVNEIAKYYADKMTSDINFRLRFNFAVGFDFDEFKKVIVLKNDELKRTSEEANEWYGVTNGDDLLKQFDAEDIDLLLVGNYFGGGAISTKNIPYFYQDFWDMCGRNYDELKDYYEENLMKLIIELMLEAIKCGYYTAINEEQLFFVEDRSYINH